MKLLHLSFFPSVLSVVVLMLLKCNPDQDNSVSNDILSLQIECTESALRSALDSISNQDGGKITFQSDHDTVDVSDRIYFYGNNLVLDGGQQEIVLSRFGQGVGRENIRSEIACSEGVQQVPDFLGGQMGWCFFLKTIRLMMQNMV